MYQQSSNGRAKKTPAVIYEEEGVLNYQEQRAEDENMCCSSAFGIKKKEDKSERKQIKSTTGE